MTDFTDRTTTGQAEQGSAERCGYEPTSHDGRSKPHLEGARKAGPPNDARVVIDLVVNLGDLAATSNRLLCSAPIWANHADY